MRIMKIEETSIKKEVAKRVFGKRKNGGKEYAKTVILSTLIVLTVILTAYKFDILRDFFSFKKSPYNYAMSKEEGLSKTIKPNQIILRFGGNKSTKILLSKQRYYEETRILLQEALASMKEISSATEKEVAQIKNMKSIQLNYRELSGKLLARSFFLEKTMIDPLGEISSIVIPLVNEDIFYVENGEKWLKIKTKALSSLPVIDGLEDSDYLNYQSLSSLFGVKSQALVPTGKFKVSFEKYDTISGVDSAKSTQIAQEIFGSKYDFTSRIIETDGSEIYSYNFGQQVLKIKPNGSIQYTNEDPDSRDTSLEEAFQTTINFVRNMGLDVSNLFLLKSKEIEVKGKKGYLFRFSETLKDTRILSSGDWTDINVIVLGGRVYSYTGIIRATLPYDLSRESDILGPLEVLSPSFNTILKNKFQVKDSNGLFDKITEIELIYYMDEDYVLTPCWRMAINGVDYLFNAYTGELEPYGLV